MPVGSMDIDRIPGFAELFIEQSVEHDQVTIGTVPVGFFVVEKLDAGCEVFRRNLMGFEVFVEFVEIWNSLEGVRDGFLLMKATSALHQALDGVSDVFHFHSLQ